MKNYFGMIFCLVIMFSIVPVKVFAAQVLQVTNSSLLIIGDNNRTYKLKLACIDVEPENEIKAKDWLSLQLPRRTKINLLPKGSDNGILIARVKTVKSGTDINQEMIDNGFAKSKC